jgi:putative endonuclease
VHPHDTPPSSRPSSSTSLPDGRPALPDGRRGPPDGRPALPDGRRGLGRLGEELAAAHLERLGFCIVARNLRTRHGEIDLIAFDGATLVFAEVKTLRLTRPRAAGRLERSPLVALRPRQRARLRRVAVAWLSDEGTARPTARTIRFDAVGVIVDATDRLVRLDHLEAAW